MPLVDNILVPIDFSPITENALEHACIISKRNQDEIALLHIVKKGDSKSQEALDKLAVLASKYANKYEVKISYYVEEGSIFTSIGEFGERNKSKFILMGTHGVKGIQHLTGAFAIRVIESSRIPVLIVQSSSTVPKHYSKIVIPIDHTEENKQKAMNSIDFARIFNSEVFLYKMYSKDELIQNKITINLNYFKKFFEKHQIKTEVEEMPMNAKEFDKEFINYAKKVAANLIIILTTPEKGLKEIVLGPVEQQVINNTEGIPVMCVNPLQTIYSSFN